MTSKLADDLFVEDDGIEYFSAGAGEEDVFCTSGAMSDEGRESDYASASELDEEGYTTEEERNRYMADLERELQENEADTATGNLPRAPTVADMRRDAARLARPHLMQKRLEVIEPCLEHAPSTGAGEKLCILCGELGEDVPVSKFEVWCGSCERYMCSLCDVRLHREGEFVLHNRIGLCDDGCNMAMDHRQFVKDGVVMHMPAPDVGVDSIFLRPLPYDAPCTQCYHGAWDQISMGGGKTTAFIDDAGEHKLLAPALLKSCSGCT